MNKYLEEGCCPTTRSSAGCASAPRLARSCRCCAARRSRTRACRRCSTRSSSSCRRRSTSLRSRASTTRSRSRARRTTIEKFAALAFKLMTDPFVGQLTFIRVYSGVLNSGDTSTTRPRARRSASAACCRCTRTSATEIKEVRAGDIAACVGLKDVTTGDTLCDPEAPIILERMVFPEPVISQAVEPKTKADQEKMGMALQRWRRKTRRSASAPTRSPARRSSRAWASCTSRSSSTA
jgi:hypothetical protein